MSNNVIPIGGSVDLPVEPCSVLDNAPRTLQSVTLIGIDDDGDFYFDSSEEGCASILLAMELAKRFLIDDLLE